MIELSNDEQYAFMNLCMKGQDVKTIPDFEAWMRSHVRLFFPFGMMAAVLGKILDETIYIEQFIGIDYPKAFLNDLQMQAKVLDRPVVANWFRERSPQIINGDDVNRSLSAFEAAEFYQYDLQNMAIHGVIDLEGRKGSYFSFSRIPGTLSRRHQEKLSLVTPHMHEVLCRIQESEKSKASLQSRSLLSKREYQILELVAQGHSNKQIAHLLSRSERTVINHVHSILSKLSVTNRTEAAVWLKQFG